MLRKQVVSKSDEKSAIDTEAGSRGGGRWVSSGCFRVGERVRGVLLQTRFGSFGTRRVKRSDVVEATCRAPYEFRPRLGAIRFRRAPSGGFESPKMPTLSCGLDVLLSVDQPTSNWAEEAEVVRKQGKCQNTMAKTPNKGKAVSG